MAYDEGLAQRIRELLTDTDGLTERKMFGGLCFLANGNMAFGVVGDELMLRVGPDRYETALGLPDAREMDFTGRSLRGMVYIGVDGIAEDDRLKACLDLAWSFAGALPPK